MAIVFNNLSAGGGSKLYKHIISIKQGSTTNQQMVTLEITNNSSEAFTLATLSKYLYDNGFNGDYGYRYPAIGQTIADKLYNSLGVYSRDGNGFYWAYVMNAVDTTTINETTVVSGLRYVTYNTFFSPYSTTNYITDTIIEL